MRASKRTFLLYGLLCSCLLLIACGSKHKAGLEKLANSFREANSASNIEAMLALYELEGSTEQSLSLLKNALNFELGMPIESIEFEPLSGAPEETIHYEHQGILYGPTLEPKHRMRVRYRTDDRFVSLFSIGQNEQGEWRIVSSRPIKGPE